MSTLSVTVILPEEFSNPEFFVKLCSKHSPFPYLRKILQNAEKLTLHKTQAELIADLFNLNSTAAPPYAALNAYANGLPAQEGFWLFADPVALAANFNTVNLMHTITDVTTEEINRLADTLNHFYADNSLRFITSNKRLYVYLKTPEKIHTFPLSEVIGKPINYYLPHGEHQQQWQQRLVETQMLLHDHPVNQVRLQQGKNPIQGLWFWGEGCLPEKSSCQLSHVSTETDWIKGLALLNHIPLLSAMPDLLPDSGRLLIDLHEQPIDAAEFSKLDANLFKSLWIALEHPYSIQIELGFRDKYFVSTGLRKKSLWQRLKYFLIIPSPAGGRGWI